MSLPEEHDPDPQPSQERQIFRKQKQLYATPTRSSDQPPGRLAPRELPDREVVGRFWHIPPTHAPTPEEQFRRHRDCRDGVELLSIAPSIRSEARLRPRWLASLPPVPRR